MITPELIEAQQKQFDQLQATILDEPLEEIPSSLDDAILDEVMPAVPEYRAPQLPCAILSLAHPGLMQAGALLSMAKQQNQVKLLRRG